MKNRSAEIADEEIIRQRIDEYVAAIRVKDLEKVMEIFAPNLVSFDLEAPLNTWGRKQNEKTGRRLLPRNALFLDLINPQPDLKASNRFEQISLRT